MLGPRSPSVAAVSVARSWAVFALVGVLALFGAGLTGCAGDSGAPELLNVIDVAPREVDVGDRIEVLGTTLPTGEAHEAQVTFKGELRRPGQAPVDAEITVEKAIISTDKVSMIFTEGLESRFCGHGDEAAHTTFRGDVIVTVPSAHGGLPVKGTVRSVEINFRPPTPRRAVIEARSREGKRALKFLGIGVADESPAAGGLLVAEITPSSPANRAGILPDDLIVSFEGVKVQSLGDMTPSGTEHLPTIGIKRGTEPVAERQISIEGFDIRPPSDLLGAGLVLGIAAAIIMLFMAPTAGIITWVERRVSARMQSRIGPNRAGPQGFLVWIADGIKSIMKEDIIPTESDQMLFRLAPYLVFMGVSATFVVMPFGQYLIAADLDIGILFVIAVTSLVTIGLMTGGWASNNKWSLLGGIRSAAQIISYEIPGAVAVVCLVMMTGSLRLQDIVGVQGGSGGSIFTTGGWPYYWYVFRNPITFALFFLYFTTALAEGNRAPFDLPEAESELVAGYSTEYSGMRYLFFFFAEWANVFVMSGIASALFLGGWQIPGVSAAQQESHFALQILGAFIFLLKSWVLIFVVVWIRWTLPRVRIDQMMNLCWKWFVPLSFGAFLLTAGWVVWNPGQTIVTAIGLVMFLVFCGLVAHFVSRVLYNLKATNAEIHLNPFI
jgi:NADH-quinone oxidoreductase subunit H